VENSGIDALNPVRDDQIPPLPLLVRMLLMRVLTVHSFTAATAVSAFNNAATPLTEGCETRSHVFRGEGTLRRDELPTLQLRAPDVNNAGTTVVPTITPTLKQP
jgi:predicted secreted protein